MAVVTAADAKARLSELVAAVADTQEHVDITRNGRPVAVLVSPVELDALRETIAILSDARAVDDIRQAEDDVRRGETTPVQQVGGTLLARTSAIG